MTASNQVQPVDDRQGDQFPAVEEESKPSPISAATAAADGKMQQQQQHQGDAIVVRNARKRYGKSQPNVLDGLNMRVPRGCIYGLLGSSGCGKTTLLSCVVGVKKLDHGEMWVLGGKPGQKDSGVPGRRVGYMPQEISLTNEFSVLGALYYFGRINGLDDSVIDERFEFFSDLLDLPPRDRLVKHMSGGQQRRVSFAASLIHRPELLILDEPTVGLDPVLREKIWKFLVKITKEEGIAVIITTHYIEEAKLANRIGLMRCGQLLAETTPTALLTKFQCPTLEDAFLILSQKQKDDQEKGMLVVGTEVIEDLDEVATHSTPASDVRDSVKRVMSSEKLLLDSQYTEKKRSGFFSPSAGRVFRALMTKNFLQFLRHPGGILFAFIFPIVQVTLFFYAIGRDPKGIVVAIVNDEAGHCDYGRNLGSIVYDPDAGTCDYIDLSCRFLNGFNESIMVKQYYDTMDEALMMVENGRAAGTMYFSQNFSRALQMRRDNLDSATEADIEAGEIQTTLDMGDRQIGLFLQKGLFERFLQIHGDVVEECKIPRKFASPPVYFEEPIFGSLDQKYSQFVAPGFILTITFFLATAVASSIIIADRAEGVWDRSLVQGVTTSEILLSHMLTQLTMVLIQVSVILCICFVHFQLPCKGSLVAVAGMIVLIGLCGMCYGFLISVLCTSHTVANFISTGSFYPIILLCGAIWPAEGMPTFLRWVSFLMPTTIPSHSLRGIMDKGYPVSEPEVYSGFLIASGWTLGFVVCCLIGLRGKGL